jgi:hypothetical protein
MLASPGRPSRLCALVALSLLIGGSAWADRDADRAAAVSALREGNRLLETGRAADALARFQDAFRLSGSPKLLYNIGQAERELPGHEVDAYESFNRYLDQALDAAPGTRAEAERMRSELRRKLGFLSVTTTPAGAQVMVDGAIRGAAPLTVTLSPGTHRLRVALAGTVAPPEEALALGAGHTLSRALDLKPIVAPLAPTVERSAQPTPLPRATSDVAAISASSDDDDPTKLQEVPTKTPEDKEDTPLYARWWLWAGIGAVVAAGATVFLVTRGSGSVVHDCPATSTSVCAPLP